MTQTCSTEQSIVEDFAFALKRLAAACEKHDIRTVEYAKAMELLRKWGYVL